MNQNTIILNQVTIQKSNIIQYQDIQMSCSIHIHPTGQIHTNLTHIARKSILLCTIPSQLIQIHSIIHHLTSLTMTHIICTLKAILSQILSMLHLLIIIIQPHMDRYKILLAMWRFMKYIIMELENIIKIIILLAMGR